MKKLFPIRILMLVIIITAAVFVVSAARSAAKVVETEECTQADKEECETKSQSEFLLQSLTRNLMGH